MVVEWFCMCKHNGASVDHLLLHYEVATSLWQAVLNLRANMRNAHMGGGSVSGAGRGGLRILTRKPYGKCLQFA